MLKMRSIAKRAAYNINAASRYLKQNFKLFSLLFCFFLLPAPTLSAQADSLLRAYQSASTTQEKAKTLLSLSSFYLNVYDSTHAKQYANELIALATSQKDTLLLIRGVNFLGNIKHLFNDFSSSRKYHEQAFALANASSSFDQMARMKYNIGNDYLSIREMGLALHAYIEGTEITKNCDCPSAKSLLNVQLSNFYNENMQDSRTALVWAKQALQYTEGDKSWRLQITKDMSTFYLALNQLDSARYFADIAYEDALKSHDKGQKADVFCLKSELEAASGHVKLALDYAQEAEKIAAELPDKGLKGRILMALGNAFLLRGDMKEAHKALLSAEKHILEGRTTQYNLPKLYNLLATTVESAESLQAVYYLRKAAIARDSINNATYKNQVMVFAMQNDNVLKEAENRQLKMEAENKEKRVRILIIPLVIVSILLLSLLYFYRQVHVKNTELSRLNTLYNQQNNALTATNQRMEWFTETLSHDALGYINNVLNYSNFGKNENYSKEITSVLEKVHKNAVSLKKMSLNLILFKKTGEVTNTSNISLMDVVEEVIEDMGDELTQSIDALSAKGLPEVYADKEFTKQVFRNILSNAVKFRSLNRPLQLIISSVEHDDVVEIKIQDNGIGIPSDKLALVFDEFTRLNKNVEGSGLGLFICQQTVEVMGGKIWAESVAEGGTVICFTLPSAKKG